MKSHLATGYIESNLAGTVYPLIVFSVFIVNGRNEKIVPVKNWFYFPFVKSTPKYTCLNAQEELFMRTDCMPFYLLYLLPVLSKSLKVF